MLTMQTILHPTDFSPRSEYAFKLACSLARDHGAKVVVLHVAAPPAVAYSEMLPALAIESYTDQAWDALRKIQAPEGVPIELRLEEGNPPEEILRVAKEIKADLIVLGTHGRTGLGRLLMGSVAELVVRRATCPVLTVKAPGSKPAETLESTATVS